MVFSLKRKGGLLRKVDLTVNMLPPETREPNAEPAAPRLSLPYTAFKLTSSLIWLVRSCQLGPKFQHHMLMTTKTSGIVAPSVSNVHTYVQTIKEFAIMRTFQ